MGAHQLGIYNNTNVGRNIWWVKRVNSRGASCALHIQLCHHPLHFIHKVSCKLLCSIPVFILFVLSTHKSGLCVWLSLVIMQPCSCWHLYCGLSLLSLSSIHRIWETYTTAFHTQVHCTMDSWVSSWLMRCATWQLNSSISQSWHYCLPTLSCCHNLVSWPSHKWLRRMEGSGRGNTPYITQQYKW